MLRTLLRRLRPDEGPDRLYCAIVARARQTDFYARLGVPDTVDGRFDMIVLHMVLVMRRLRAGGEAGQGLAQSLLDAFFADMDRSLREMGVGDLGVPKKIKLMARAFYGRAAAYESALSAGDLAGLQSALERNVFAAPGSASAAAQALAAYAVAVGTVLDDAGMAGLAAGELPAGWPGVPQAPGEAA